MKIIRYSCPICYKDFESKTTACDRCGFDGIVKCYWEFEGKELYESYIQNELFNVYKFAKNVFYKKIPFEKATLDTNTDPEDCKTHILGADGKYGVAVVDLHNDENPVIAEDGLLAFDHTKALIINTDEIKSNVLDESMVRILFLGPDVKVIEGDYLRGAYLKYILVDSNNKQFSSENNVLFNKDKTKLILYPSLKNEEEYYVPKTVNEFSPLAFRSLKNLKRLYIPSGAKLTAKAIGNADNPEFTVIKY
ncbi:MAG: hypothetical protein IJX02_05140 [Clostridia bacterium]|nr:hypothetical protein [Clostridia bacterium]